MNVAALRAKHGELMEQMKALADSTAADAFEKFNAVDAELTDIRSRLQEADSVEGRRARFAAVRQEADRTVVRPESRGQAAFDGAEYRKWLTRRDANSQYEIDVRTLSTGTTTPFGGYTIPTIQTGEFYKWADWAYPVRELTTVLQYAQPYDLPVINGRTTVAATAEAAAFNSSEFTVDRRQFKAYKATAETELTDELSNDSVVDMAGEIMADHVRGHARYRAEKHCVGTGSSQEQGIFTHSAYLADNVVRTGVATANVDFDDIISLYSKIRPTYLSNASWVMHPNTWGTLLKLRDDANGAGTGRYLYDGFTGNVIKEGASGLLMGRPVYLCEFAPEFVSGTAGNLVFFGDLKRSYRIVDRTQMQFLYDPYTKSSNGIVMYKSQFRSDAMVVDKYAGGVIRNAASGA